MKTLIIGDVTFKTGRLIKSKSTDHLIFESKCKRDGKKATLPRLNIVSRETISVIRPKVHKKTLKKAQKARLLDALTKEQGDNLSAVMAAMAEKAGAKAKQIDYRLLPDKWFKSRKCHDVQVFVRVQYETRELDIRAGKAREFDGELFDVGEEIANFWYTYPVGIFLTRVVTFKKECCKNSTGQSFVSHNDYPSDAMQKKKLAKLAKKKAEKSAMKKKVMKAIKKVAPADCE
ncbi:MAG: hypothetical protein ACPGGK_05870 [Pikeienuella sp.]